MSKQRHPVGWTTFLMLCLAVLWTSQALSAEFEIVILDSEGVGYNDATPVDPIGGNTGTTLGEQRLNVLRRAAEIWGEVLESDVTIQVIAMSEIIPCVVSNGSVSAVLAGARAKTVITNFANTPNIDVLYPIALANALAGTDLSLSEDIETTMNLAIDESDSCQALGGFYYGLDHQPGDGEDFLEVMLHELGHGLGFTTLVNESNGTLFQGRVDIAATFMQDQTTGKLFSQMTNSERLVASRNDPNLVWVGPQASEAAVAIVQGVYTMEVISDSGTQTLSYRQTLVGEAFTPDVGGEMVIVDDGTDDGSVGCGPLVNDLTGKVAFIDRGSCTFQEKILNAQAAGAVLAVIANNTPGDGEFLMGFAAPTLLTIPAVTVSYETGQALRALSGTQIYFRLDESQEPAAINGGFPRLHAPFPVSPGSSLSHWSPDFFPNFLMEPNATNDIGDTVDVSREYLADIGWPLKQATVDVSHRLVYPWISNREGVFRSTLVANNLSDQEQLVELTARREDGSSAKVMRRIPANGFLAESAADLFPDLPEGSGFSVTLGAETDQIYGRWVTDNLLSASGASPSQGVAIPIPVNGGNGAGLSGREILFGFLPVTNNFTSGPVVVNLGDSPADIALAFYDESGNPVGSAVISQAEPLAPFARIANDLVPDAAGDLYMVATSSQPLTGVSFVFNSVFNEPAIGNAMAIDSAGADTGSANLLFAWVSNRDGEFESTIVINNRAGRDANLSLTARRADGTSQTVTRQVSAGGFLKENASSLFTELGSGSGYAVSCSADTSKVTGVWVSNNLQAASGASPSQGVAVDYSNLAADSARFGTRMLFGYLPISASEFSAPAIVNLGSAATDVALHFYDRNGNLLLSDTQTGMGLEPLVPLAIVANSLLPESTSAAYMVASSPDQPLTGVVFVFNAAKEPALGNATAVP